MVKHGQTIHVGRLPLARHKLTKPRPILILRIVRDAEPCKRDECRKKHPKVVLDLHHTMGSSYRPTHAACHPRLQPPSVGSETSLGHGVLWLRLVLSLCVCVCHCLCCQVFRACIIMWFCLVVPLCVYLCVSWFTICCNVCPCLLSGVVLFFAWCCHYC